MTDWVAVKNALPPITGPHHKYGSYAGYYADSDRLLLVVEQNSGKRMVKEGFLRVWNNDINQRAWKVPGTCDKITHWMPLPKLPDIEEK